ncbi:serine hydrolase [Flavihumibacter fluvii]|uniref:serine hydrolase n=1 Tax=Flavihumibacter fluvii TaxID=2838157 RepID=UPI001BDE06B1|nr:serine hydrolase [Flavihumibacter fluvii]ULQ52898.1 serine hydrolase [Flavihumibacter fluvii]
MKQFILILLTLGLARASFAQSPTTAKIDALLSAYAQLNLFNGSALVAQKGKILLQKGYGTKASGIFQIYSITKTFTSTLVLKLSEEGKLSVTDKLSKYYPGFPKGDSITIEQLLSHTSGLFDYTHGNDMPDMQEKTLIGFLSKKELDFAPGTGWSYSNSGYYLLGYIIQRVTGIPYEQAIHQYILDPVQMTRSGFDFKALASPNKTIGYSVFTSKEKKPAIIYAAPGPFAAGAIYSTVGDLFKYHQALQKFSIISKASLDKAYTPLRNNYGLGWFTSSFEGQQVVGHSGGAAGFRSNFVRIPELDLCIVLLSNNEIANLDLITRRILAVLFSKPYQVPVERYCINREAQRAITGTYSNDTFHVYIYVADGKLVAQPATQRKSVLLAQSPLDFYVDDLEGHLLFKKDSNNKITQMVVKRNGKEDSFKRIYPGWGLLGNATAVGWEGRQPDLVFTEDAQHKGIWTITNIQLSTGNIKFRFDNDWTINFGDNDADGKLEADGSDIKVAAGRYDILLDLTDEEQPGYILTMRQP